MNRLLRALGAIGLVAISLAAFGFFALRAPIMRPDPATPLENLGDANTDYWQKVSSAGTAVHYIAVQELTGGADAHRRLAESVELFSAIAQYDEQTIIESSAPPGWSDVARDLRASAHAFRVWTSHADDLSRCTVAAGGVSMPDHLSCPDKRSSLVADYMMQDNALALKAEGEAKALDPLIEQVAPTSACWFVDFASWARSKGLRLEGDPSIWEWGTKTMYASPCPRIPGAGKA